MNKVNLLYLSSNPSEWSTSVIEVGSDTHGNYVVLAETPFFPKGGGQPCDLGILINQDHESIEVNLVTIVNGDARHYLDTHNADLINISDIVTAKIDLNRRHEHTVLHTAGELIAGSMRSLGFDESMVSGAIHYPENSCLRYKPKSLKLPLDHLLFELKNSIDSHLQRGGNVEISNVNGYDNILKSCNYVPSYLDTSQSIRVVTVVPPFGRPCMGSHLNSLSELKNVRIVSMKIKKGELIVRYSAS